MEPRDRYAEMLFLLTGAVLYEVLALQKSFKIDEQTVSGKEVQQKQVFL